MERFLLLFCCVVIVGSSLFGCESTEREPTYAHEHLFTLPFAKEDVTFVSYADGWEVAFGSGTYQTLRAPQHVTVVDTRVGAVELRHADVDAVMILDDLDVVWVDTEDQLCAGQSFGKTRQARLRVFWGGEEFAEDSDLSTVRVNRNGYIEDLSYARIADRLRSVLRLEGHEERSTDINRDACPYNDTDGGE